MATPNQMPSKHSKLKEQVLDGLIASSPSVWKKKALVTDEYGKEHVEEQRVSRTALRFPLAQNMSEANVEALAKRWIK